MAEILQLRGPRAASESRLAKLVAFLKKSDPGTRSAAAEYRYLVQTSRSLTTEELRLLERLLDDGTPKPPSASGKLYLVVPRLADWGTVLIVTAMLGFSPLTSNDRSGRPALLPTRFQRKMRNSSLRTSNGWARS